MRLAFLSKKLRTEVLVCFHLDPAGQNNAIITCTCEHLTAHARVNLTVHSKQHVVLATQLRNVYKV